MAGKILVIRGGAIGDFILTLPALRLLRETLPEAHVEVLGYRPAVELAEMAGYANAVRSIEYSAMAGFFIPGSKLDPELEAYFGSFSVVVSYLYDPDGFFRGNLDRAGVDTIVQGLHKVVEPGAHAARQLAAPLEGLAMFLDEGAEAAVIPGQERDRELVAWHPGSGSVKKNWDVEKWVELFGELGISELLVISGEAEEAVVDGVLGLLDGKGIRVEVARCLEFSQLAKRLREVKLFLGHDSGVSHFAAACGAPCVLVFGSTNPGIWAPANAEVSVVVAPDGELEALEVGEVVEHVAGRSLL